jgi:UDP-N-acetylenolpyruvoylglucosamine reductase
VARLVATVRTRVADATGVDLVPELQMVGFDSEPVTVPDPEVQR